MAVKDFLSQTAFWQINKSLAKAIGRDEAFLLSDLISKYEYFLGNKETIQIDNESYFFATSESIENDTMFTYYEQKKLLSKLEKYGLIKIAKKGIPAKLYFHIVENKILSIFNSSIQKTSKLELEKVENYYKNKDKNIDKNNINMGNDFENNDSGINTRLHGYQPTTKDTDTKPKQSKFIIPTIDEIQAYIKEKNLSVDANKFFDFYQSKGWYVGKNKMKDWTAALRNWNSNNKQTSNKQAEPEKPNSHTYNRNFTNMSREEYLSDIR